MRASATWWPRAKPTIVRMLETLIADDYIARDNMCGGYRVTSVTPIDQFLWSPHVEVVALLKKPKKRR